jgi:hypothetical protein
VKHHPEVALVFTLPGRIRMRVDVAAARECVSHHARSPGRGRTIIQIAPGGDGCNEVPDRSPRHRKNQGLQRRPWRTGIRLDDDVVVPEPRTRRRSSFERPVRDRDILQEGELCRNAFQVGREQNVFDDDASPLGELGAKLGDTRLGLWVRTKRSEAR